MPVCSSIHRDQPASALKCQDQRQTQPHSLWKILETHVLFVLHKLLARPYCWRQHSISQWIQRRWADAWLDFTLLTRVHGTERYFVKLPEEKGNHHPNNKPVIHKGDLPAGSLFWLDLKPAPWRGTLTLLSLPRTRDWIGHGPRVKPNNVLLKDHSNETTPSNILLYP